MDNFNLEDLKNTLEQALGKGVVLAFFECNQSVDSKDHDLLLVKVATKRGETALVEIHTPYVDGDDNPDGYVATASLFGVDVKTTMPIEKLTSANFKTTMSIETPTADNHSTTVPMEVLTDADKLTEMLSELVR